MVNIRKISEDSFDALIGMNRSEGDPFVASNAVTLGHALL